MNIREYLRNFLGINDVQKQIDYLFDITHISGDIAKQIKLNGFTPPPKKCLRERGGKYYFMGKQI
jgi:hypothetical protein